MWSLYGCIMWVCFCWSKLKKLQSRCETRLKDTWYHVYFIIGCWHCLLNIHQLYFQQWFRRHSILQIETISFIFIKFYSRAIKQIPQQLRSCFQIHSNRICRPSIFIDLTDGISKTFCVATLKSLLTFWMRSASQRGALHRSKSLGWRWIGAISLSERTFYREMLQRFAALRLAV